jgi:hypothetical protein
LWLIIGFFRILLKSCKDCSVTLLTCDQQVCASIRFQTPTDFASFRWLASKFRGHWLSVVPSSLVNETCNFLSDCFVFSTRYYEFIPVHLATLLVCYGVELVNRYFFQTNSSSAWAAPCFQATTATWELHASGTSATITITASKPDLYEHSPKGPF